MMIDRYRDDEVVGTFMKKLERALPDMFLFVDNPATQLTTRPNAACANRSYKDAYARCLRLEKSMDRTCNMLTCLVTRKSRGLSCLDETVGCV